MLQDEFLSEYDFSEVHSIKIQRTPAQIFPLVIELDFTQSWIIRILFTLRGMTSGVRAKEGLLRQSFVDLGSKENEEILLGLVGQFWKPHGKLQRLSLTEFKRFDKEDFLKCTWNFSLRQSGDNQTTLTTETRVKCLGIKARKRFSRYWFFIRPFSGIIRKEILKAVKKKSEAKRIIHAL